MFTDDELDNNLQNLIQLLQILHTNPKLKSKHFWISSNKSQQKPFYNESFARQILDVVALNKMQ